MSIWNNFPNIILEPESSESKYIQLAHSIENLIRRGDVTAHTKLPSENELDEALNLSRSTVRKALDELDKKGLVYRRQGQGTFVQEVQTIGRKKENSISTGKIGLIIPSMMNEIYPLIVKGVEDSAANHGYSVFIGNTYSDRDRELSLLNQMIESGVDALILEPTNARLDQPGTPIFKLLKNLQIPYVILDSEIQGLNASEVSLDDIEGGYLAGNFLLDHNHTHLAYIYKETVIAAIHRREGLIKAFRERSISSESIQFLPYKEEDEMKNPAYSYTKDLLRSKNRPSAIFYYNDENALNGLQAIREAGLNVPKDISIIGFDNINSASNPGIELTTVEHPKYFCGRWAADIIFNQLSKSSTTSRQRITIHPEIVVRKTVTTYHKG